MIERDNYDKKENIWGMYLNFYDNGPYLFAYS